MVSTVPAPLVEIVAVPPTTLPPVGRVVAKTSVGEITSPSASGKAMAVVKSALARRRPGEEKLVLINFALVGCIIGCPFEIFWYAINIILQTIVVTALQLQVNKKMMFSLPYKVKVTYSLGEN